MYTDFHRERHSVGKYPRPGDAKCAPISRTPTIQTPTNNIFYERQLMCSWMENHMFFLARISSEHIAHLYFNVEINNLADRRACKTLFSSCIIIYYVLCSSSFRSITDLRLNTTTTQLVVFFTFNIYYLNSAVISIRAKLRFRKSFYLISFR